MANDWAALKKQRWLLRGIHVWVDPAVSVYEGHQIGHKVKDQIMASEGLVQDVTVHIEPATPDLNVARVFRWKADGILAFLTCLNGKTGDQRIDSALDVLKTLGGYVTADPFSHLALRSFGVV